VPHAPYDGLRGERILTALLHARRVRTDHIHEPQPVSIRALRRVHSDEYLERLSDPHFVAEIVGCDPTNETTSRVLEMQRSVVGGTLLATSHALYSRRTAVNLGGGTHHARRDGGGGFCIYNDVAVAIERQRAEGFRGRVLVIDLDLHDGNGTREIFADDPDVFTFSIHNTDWTDTDAVAAFSLTLHGEVEDTEYLEAIREHLPPVVEQHRAALVYYVAGVDPAADDRIGNWKITAEGMLARDLFVMKTLAAGRKRRGPIPVVITLGGGYGDEAWRYSARFLSALGGGDPVEPPSTGEITLLHYRRLARDLEREEEEQSEYDWGLTDEDVFGALDGDRGPRLLGRYTPHDFELTLERLGFLDRIREKGFLHPVLDFQPDGSGFILYSDSERREPLIELLLKLDKSTRPGHGFLRIEWLLMQNPRRRFSKDRPRLPGQQNPGLGLLYDILSILVVVCERMELDGVLFVPSHFHLAVQGRRILRGLDPADEATLRQIIRLVEGLPLGSALEAIELGRIRSLETGETIGWRPLSMVMPTSERLRHELESEAYERAVEQEMAGLRWVLEGHGVLEEDSSGNRQDGRMDLVGDPDGT